MLTHPRALLLDFGGVIVEAPTRAPAPVELVDRLHVLVDQAVPRDQIARDLVDGARAYATWRDVVSGTDRPVELSHEQVWCDYVVRNWPDPARTAVRAEAGSLSYAWTWRPDWAVRPGITRLLDAAASAGLPVAVVSNTLCGAAHRDFLATNGLARQFAAQFYSDEVGVRKPHPEMALRAAEALSVPIGECWFVGDSLGRDIACARRAGTGAAVLMRSARTDREPLMPALVPDATVDDGHGVVTLLHQVLGWPRAHPA